MIVVPKIVLCSAFRYTKRHFFLSALIAVAVLGASVSRAPARESEEVSRFETDVLPIVQANCLLCHGENLQQNGLDLRTRDSIQKGGESGPAIVPGSAEESLLFEKVSSGEMPMGGEKLSDEEIELIERWINAGGLRVGENLQSVLKRARRNVPTEPEIMVSILYPNCLVCHGKQKQEGGLDLRVGAGVAKRGKIGPGDCPRQAGRKPPDPANRCWGDASC